MTATPPECPHCGGTLRPGWTVHPSCAKEARAVTTRDGFDVELPPAERIRAAIADPTTLGAER